MICRSSYRAQGKTEVRCENIKPPEHDPGTLHSRDDEFGRIPDLVVRFAA